MTRSLRERNSWIARLAIAMTVLFLSACSHFPGRSNTPTTTDRFALPPQGEDVIGTVQVVTAHYSDTLPDIARRYDLGYEEIVAANPGVDPWLPGEGTRVILPTQFVLPDAPREGLVLNLAAMRLFWFPQPAEGEPPVVITHPVGIGREGWQTPEGLMSITHKKEKPAWTVPESVRQEHAAEGKPLPAIMASGPDNPLGEYAMRLSDPLYLIHGTNQPYGVGLRVSHGCVRLYPEDIARLFPQVPVGTPVRIVNQPYVTGWRKGQLYLEAHQPLAEQAKLWGNSLNPMKTVVAKKSAGEVNWSQAERVAREAKGIPFPISTGSPDLDEVLSDAPRVTNSPPYPGS